MPRFPGVTLADVLRNVPWRLTPANTLWVYIIHPLGEVTRVFPDDLAEDKARQVPVSNARRILIAAQPPIPERTLGRIYVCHGPYSGIHDSKHIDAAGLRDLLRQRAYGVLVRRQDGSGRCNVRAGMMQVDASVMADPSLVAAFVLPPPSARSDAHITVCGETSHLGTIALSSSAIVAARNAAVTLPTAGDELLLPDAATGGDRAGPFRPLHDKLESGDALLVLPRGAPCRQYGFDGARTWNPAER